LKHGEVVRQGGYDEMIGQAAWCLRVHAKSASTPLNRSPKG
jgi:hypothetical protein